MHPIALRITIPPGVAFEDLRLVRHVDNGDVSFDWTPLERICAASGIDVDLFRTSAEDNVAAIINAWYAAHRASGGAADAVQEQLLAEVAAEDEHGGGYSYSPGTA